MISRIVDLLLVDFTVQLIGWAISAIIHSEKFFDLTGSFTFLLLTIVSRNKGRQTVRQNIQSFCVIIWALRLGSFLFYRILQAGKDSRFDQMRHFPTKMFGVWMIQGVWVFITLLPTLYLNQKQRDKPLTTLDYLGWSLWLFGFIFEVIADGQKLTFRQDPLNKEKFIQTGLWKYSRHPNYFGEICLWFGLYLSSSHMLRGYECFLGLLSPAFVTFLLSFVSGIPLLEQQALKQFGHDASYRLYRSQTPVLIPFVNFPRI